MLEETAVKTVVKVTFLYSFYIVLSILVLSSYFVLYNIFQHCGMSEGFFKSEKKRFWDVVEVSKCCALTWKLSKTNYQYFSRLSFPSFLMLQQNKQPVLPLHLFPNEVLCYSWCPLVSGSGPSPHSQSVHWMTRMTVMTRRTLEQC